MTKEWWKKRIENEKKRIRNLKNMKKNSKEFFEEEEQVELFTMIDDGEIDGKDQ